MRGDKGIEVERSKKRRQDGDGKEERRKKGERWKSVRRNEKIEVKRSGNRGNDRGGKK